MIYEKAGQLQLPCFGMLEDGCIGILNKHSGNLSSGKKDGKTFYVHEYKSDDSTGRCRRHIGEDSDLTRQLARKKYLEKFIPQFSKEADRLRRFIDGTQRGLQL